MNPSSHEAGVKENRDALKSHPDDLKLEETDQQKPR